MQGPPGHRTGNGVPATTCSGCRGDPPRRELVEPLHPVAAQLLDVDDPGLPSRDDVGVDELAEQVARGAWLVEVCRARLHRAELAVSDVVEALRAQEAAEPTDAGGR